MPRVIAVVPTYHPDHDVVAHMRALRAQVDRLIVVDDGSGPAADGVLAEIEGLEASVVRLGRNRGIAGALNAGVREALADGADFVVTTDQDTDLPADYVADCLATFRAANPVTRLGIVCADRVNGQPSLPTWTSPEGLGLVPEAIQSGFVVAREVFERAGLFDERLVIDCVDTEYCIRVRDRGFRIAIARGTDIAHELGEMVPFRPFGLRRRNRTGAFEYQYHSPFRQYYIVRNNIDLVYRTARRHPRWAAAVVKRQIGPALDAVTSGPQRWRHLVATVVGGVHGFFRIRGPIPAGLRRYLTRS
ncbi:glycosyltransferase [Agromyces aerolatus]|uniref:glycosyltransferase n=1 Tax=Agromyces sp. LY-1074 TaxID=3074080 RepID=UPI00285673BF|nr:MULTISPECIES: glycosyltransferase [unclassified Agromyces]MDR5700365.1 glycosyltransferase [Agromyces sp. LY-1074]MDR5706657.1 glycosyltransferase [Agromyces sp. LY-1358]